MQSPPKTYFCRNTAPPWYLSKAQWWRGNPLYILRTLSSILTERKIHKTFEYAHGLISNSIYWLNSYRINRKVTGKKWWQRNLEVRFVAILLVHERWTQRSYSSKEDFSNQAYKVTYSVNTRQPLSPATSNIMWYAMTKVTLVAGMKVNHIFSNMGFWSRLVWLQPHLSSQDQHWFPGVVLFPVMIRQFYDGIQIYCITSLVGAISFHSY